MCLIALQRQIHFVSRVIIIIIFDTGIQQLHTPKILVFQYWSLKYHIWRIQINIIIITALCTEMLSMEGK